MGALTSNRKRGDDFHTFNSRFPFPKSPQLDTHISKKPKTSSSMQFTPDRLIPSKTASSRVYRYPEPVNQIRREVHAPCRVSRLGFGSSRRGSRSKEDLADEMGNVLSDGYYTTKNIAIESLRYLRRDLQKDKEVRVIEVDEESDRGDASEDSRIEEVEVVVSDRRLEETNNTIEPNLIQLDGKVAEPNFQQSSSSVVSDLTNGKLRTELLSLDRESKDLGFPVHKRLLERAERRDSKLKSLSLQVGLTEKLLATLQLLRPPKKTQDEDVLQDVLCEPFVPLTNEEEADVSRAFSNSSRRKVLATHENSNIEVTGELLQCLRLGAWLNDEVINVYLELLKEREKREPKKFLKCHFFNTFFYKKLISGRSGYDFKSVKRWTSQRKLGYCLLECDKIFVPIHQQIHWCLAVINKKDKKFQYLDSLRGIDTQVLNVLARYFVDEVKDKSGVDIDASSWTQEYVEDLPVQENGSDCGVFMIKYADFYSRGLGLCFKQEHMPYFRLRTAKEILRLKAE